MYACLCKRESLCTYERDTCTCMHVCVCKRESLCVCIYTYVCVCMAVYMCMYTCVPVFGFERKCVCVCMSVRVCEREFEYMCVCVCVCESEYIYVWVCEKFRTQLKKKRLIKGQRHWFFLFWGFFVCFFFTSIPDDDFVWHQMAIGEETICHKKVQTSDNNWLSLPIKYKQKTGW